MSAIERGYNKNRFEIPGRLADDLDGFFSKWEQNLVQVELTMPDFSQPDWKYQNYPAGYSSIDSSVKPFMEAQGARERVPYFVMPRIFGDQQIRALEDLLESAELTNHTVVVEVGSSRSLSPLTTALNTDRTIVIAIDNNGGPSPIYPCTANYKDAYSRGDYSFVAKYIHDTPGFPSSSAAFFFRGDIHQAVLRKALHERAFRVQVVAPDPEADHGQALIDLLSIATDFVGPDGEFMIVGDGSPLRSFSIENILRPDRFIKRSKPYAQLSRIHDQYRRAHAYMHMTGEQLFRGWGISDSRWIHTISMIYEVYSNDFIREYCMPGLFVFSGKKMQEI